MSLKNIITVRNCTYALKQILLIIGILLMIANISATCPCSGENPCNRTVIDYNDTHNLIIESTYLCGDVNGDDIVNIFDAMLLRYHVAYGSGSYPLECNPPTITYYFEQKTVNKSINLTTSYDGYTCKYMDSTYDMFTTDNAIAIGKLNDLMTDRDKGFAEFDISSIPINAHITNVIFKYDGRRHNMDCNISNMTIQPTVSTAQQIYDNIGTGTDYYNDAGFPEIGNNKSINLGIYAINDLQRKINNSITWFSIGLYTNSPISPVSLINASENIDAAPPPTLQIDYQVPAEHGTTIETKLISTHVGARKTTMAAAFMLLSGMFMMVAIKRRQEDE